MQSEEKTTTPVAIALVGPTAIGKSDMALRLAKELTFEIIGCDSMQIYRYMDIGTAKPTPFERAVVPHHMIDCVEPSCVYSAADYGEEAYAAALAITAKGRVPLFCGGTGLYLEAARAARHAHIPEIDPALRARLAEEARERGIEALLGELATVDPESAALCHKNNEKRILRALEIYRGTGRTKTEFDHESRALPPRLRLLTLCLLPEDREALRERIDVRVDRMLEMGLVDEVRALLARGYLREGTTARQGIGYKETAEMLEGRLPEEALADTIKVATHRYARRQLTWFRGKGDTVFLPVGKEGATEKTHEAAAREISAFLKHQTN